MLQVDSLIGYGFRCIDGKGTHTSLFAILLSVGFVKWNVAIVCSVGLMGSHLICFMCRTGFLTVVTF